MDVDGTIEKRVAAAPFRPLNNQALNDDCMVAVLSFLSIRERLRLARVNRRFRRLVRLTWITTRRLTFTRALFGVSPAKVRRFRRILRKTLRRGGVYVRVLDLSTAKYEHLRQTDVMDSLTLCPNLMDCDFGDFAVGSLELVSLTVRCPSIRYLHMQKVREDVTEELVNDGLIAAVPNLTRFTVGHLIFREPLKFGNPSHVQYLSLLDCTICVHTLLQMFPLLIDLRTLYLDGSIIDCLVLGPLSMTGLSRLQQLSISRNKAVVNDDILFDVARECPRLTHLYLDWNPSITDCGVRRVLASCNLAYLSINGFPPTSQITGSSLDSANGLERLALRSCRLLEPRYFEILLMTSSDLQYLDLREIDTDVVDAIIDILREAMLVRKSLLHLYVYVDESKWNYIDIPLRLHFVRGSRDNMALFYNLK